MLELPGGEGRSLGATKTFTGRVWPLSSSASIAGSSSRPTVPVMSGPASTEPSANRPDLEPPAPPTIPDPRRRGSAARWKVELPIVARHASATRRKPGSRPAVPCPLCPPENGFKGRRA